MVKRYWRGFTIVELLIVIVVIAILASISIVAYNGIQTRASNTQTISMVSQYEKALKSYVALYNKYPQFYGSACLGTGYPDRDGDGTGDCGGSDYPVHENTDFDTAMHELVGSMPVVNTRPLLTGGGIANVGAWIINWDEFSVNGQSTPYYIMYALWGNNQDCGNSGIVDVDGAFPHMKHPASQSYSWNDGGTTMCVLPLANI